MKNNLKPHPIKQKHLKIFYGGEIIDSWPCDCDPITGQLQSNGGQEFLVLYKKRKHGFVCDWDDNPIIYTGIYKEYGDGL